MTSPDPTPRDLFGNPLRAQAAPRHELADMAGTAIAFLILFTVVRALFGAIGWTLREIAHGVRVGIHRYEVWTITRRTRS